MDAESKRFIQRRVGEEFPGGIINASNIASNIAFGVAVLGGGHVELVSEGPWWFVASEFDWLSPSGAEYADAAELFERIVPFPEQGPDSYRSEVYVGAYAERAYLSSPTGTRWLIGNPDQAPLPHQDAVPSWCVHVLGFAMP